MVTLHVALDSRKLVLGVMPGDNAAMFSPETPLRLGTVVISKRELHIDSTQHPSCPLMKPKSRAHSISENTKPAFDAVWPLKDHYMNVSQVS
jgi:hypothetical protein